MAFTCGFFNSQNGDRKYNAEQMASIFDGLIKDGVYDTVGDIFAVTPGTGMQVLVGSGRAWFDHTWNNNDAQYPLAITAADVSLPRYDAVVLETNHSDTVRTNRLRVLTGTPASNPVKPTMTSTANVKQHPLAYIKVTAGATSITASMIQVVVGTSECPFVTGIIDTAQIDALFQQWNGEFNEWFENLKAQLSDNVVANLQAQIDQKVAKADVATKADIEAGTSTTKWVSPKGLREANIGSAGNHVGDVLCTARTDLGDDWALCNGDSILSIDASAEALNVFDKSFGLYKQGDLMTIPKPAGAGTDYEYHIATAIELINNQIVVGGYTYMDSTYRPTIWWKTYPNGGWNSVIFTGSTGSIDAIRYFDGKYIFIYPDSVGNRVTLVANSLSTSISDYTNISLSNQPYFRITNLFKFGDYYCFYGYENNAGTYIKRFAFCTSISANITCTGYGGFDYNMTPWDITFFNDGYLYLTGYRSTKYYKYPLSIKVPFLPTTQNNVTTYYTVSNVLYDNTNQDYGLYTYWRYNNAHYCVGGPNLSFYTTDLSNWTSKTISTTKQLYEYMDGPKTFDIGGSYIIPTERYLLIVKKDLSNSVGIVAKSLVGSDYDGYDMAVCQLDVNNYLIACKNVIRQVKIDENGIVLPTITTDKTYNYIKIK